MRRSVKDIRLGLGAVLAALLVSASLVGTSKPATAFGMGFGRGGGFGGRSVAAPGRTTGRSVYQPGRGTGASRAPVTGGSVSRGGTTTTNLPTGGGTVSRGGTPTTNLPMSGGGIGRVPITPGVPTAGTGIGRGGVPIIPILPVVPPGGGGGGATPPALAGGGNSGGSGVPPRGERRYVPDEIITAFSSSATPESIEQLARRYNLTRLDSQSFPLIGSTLYRWRIGSRRSVPDVVGAIEDERTVASAQPNYVFTAQEEATKSAARHDAAQYVLDKLQIEQAHRVATGKNIPVALIDSAIDASHPDLGGAIVKSFDALGGTVKPHAHGTAMAGAIAAHGKLLGVALGPQILAARAFDDAGEAKGTSFAIYKSLQWAADNAARIVNMSFAGPADPTLHRMLAAASEKGMVLIAAAGNAGPSSPPLFPAADPNVIAVTATDSKDGLFKMANHGAYIAVAAPGVDIVALAPGDSYQATTGTSVAAAHVSGIVALLLELKPSLKPEEVRTILANTAKPLGTAGQRADFGAGLANAFRAVTMLNDQSAKKLDDPSVKNKGDEQAKE